MNKKDLTGMTFGKLVVVSKAENIGKNTAWLCRCDCGVERPMLTYNLLAKKSQSCGCVRGIKIGNFSRTHGGSGTRLHRIFKGMKQRCENQSVPAYQYYGAKGISVCEKWRDNFETFKEWSMNNGYGDCLTIDRIDPTLGYSPENCRWTTKQNQANNKLNSMFVIIDGDKLTVAEWADRHKSNKPVLYSKFYRLLEQLGIENKTLVSFEIKTKRKESIP